VIIVSLLLIFAAVLTLVFGVAERSAPLLIVSIVATLMAVIVLIASARSTAAARLAAGADDREGGGSERAGTERPSAKRSRPVRAEPVRSKQTRSAEGATVHSGAVGTVIEGSVVEEPPDPVRTTGSAAGDGSRESPIPTQARPTIDLDIRPDDDVRDVDDVPDVLGAEDEGEIEGYIEGEFTEDDPPGEPPQQLVSPDDAKLVARLDSEVFVVDGRPRYHRANCAFLRSRETETLPVRQALELGFTPCGRCEPDSALIAGARSG
jgi:hypothetical protein